MGRHTRTTVTSAGAAPATAIVLTCLTVVAAAVLLLGLPADVARWQAITQGRECVVPAGDCVETRSALLDRRWAGRGDFRRKYCLPGPPYGHCVRLPAIDVIRTKGALDDGTPDVAVIHEGALVAVRTSTGAELRGFNASALRWVAPLFLALCLALAAVAGVTTAAQRRRAGWRWFAKEGPAAPVGGVAVGLAVAWPIVGLFDFWVYQLMGETTAIVGGLVAISVVSCAVVWASAVVRRQGATA